MGIYDVPAGMLIEECAKDFKARIKKPAFTDWVKTGAHRERAPNNPDWFFTRMASVLYRAYKEGNIGTGRLRTYYGGRKNRGVRPEHKAKASGKVLRVCLQMLEKDGMLKKDKKGRSATPKGEKFLGDKAKAVKIVFDEMLKKGRMASEEDAQRRAANRAKAAQAAQAAQQAQTQMAQQKAQQVARHQEQTAKNAKQALQKSGAIATEGTPSKGGSTGGRPDEHAAPGNALGEHTKAEPAKEKPHGTHSETQAGQPKERNAGEEKAGGPRTDEKGRHDG